MGEGFWCSHIVFKERWFGVVVVYWCTQVEEFFIRMKQRRGEAVLKCGETTKFERREGKKSKDLSFSFVSFGEFVCTVARPFCFVLWFCGCIVASSLYLLSLSYTPQPPLFLLSSSLCLSPGL